MWGRSGGGLGRHLQVRGEASEETNLADTLIGDFQPLGL